MLFSIFKFVIPKFFNVNAYKLGLLLKSKDFIFPFSFPSIKTSLSFGLLLKSIVSFSVFNPNLKIYKLGLFFI